MRIRRSTTTRGSDLTATASGPGALTRALVLPGEQELAQELRRLGVHPEGVPLMAGKGVHLNLLVPGLDRRAAQLLKQEALGQGAEAALPWPAAADQEGPFTALLMGSLVQLRAVIGRLAHPALGLGPLAAHLEQALTHYLQRAPWQLTLPDGRVLKGGRRTLVMGIINVTDDSFSGDGLGASPQRAAEQAARMADEGADLLDVGAESTRPGAAPVPVDQELVRLLPCLEAVLARTGLPVSVDTYKARVARAALGAGASMVNDISGLRDPEMPAVIVEREAPVVVMHIKGTPRNMQQSPHYQDLLGEVYAYLADCLARAAAAGIPETQVIVDPGFGFGKAVEHNLELLRRLGELRSLGRPVLAGTSRKSTIGRVLGGLPPEERLEGTAATVALAIANGADLVRVHDVKAMVRVARMTDAVVRGWQP